MSPVPLVGGRAVAEQLTHLGRRRRLVREPVDEGAGDQVDADDEALTLGVLADLGYAVETDWRPVRVEVVRPGSGWVDVHPVVFDAAGNGVQAGLDDTEFHYPAEIFTTGRVGGIVVGCVSAAAQRTAHEGYAPRPQDVHDVAQLAALAAVDDGPS